VLNPPVAVVAKNAHASKKLKPGIHKQINSRPVTPKYTYSKTRTVSLALTVIILDSGLISILESLSLTELTSAGESNMNKTPILQSNG
jgi:hypothetical protein